MQLVVPISVPDLCQKTSLSVFGLMPLSVFYASLDFSNPVIRILSAYFYVPVQDSIFFKKIIYLIISGLPLFLCSFFNAQNGFSIAIDLCVNENLKARRSESTYYQKAHGD